MATTRSTRGLVRKAGGEFNSLFYVLPGEGEAPQKDNALHHHLPK